MREDVRDAILAVAELIPAGKVLSYGDIGQLLAAGGPRLVGTVLSRFGSAVPWWRVIRADGKLAAPLAERALPHYRAEATVLRGVGTCWKVDMAAARWMPRDADWQRIDGIARQLRPADSEDSELSVPDDRMQL